MNIQRIRSHIEDHTIALGINEYKGYIAYGVKEQRQIWIVLRKIPNIKDHDPRVLVAALLYIQRFDTQVITKKGNTIIITITHE